MMGVGVVSVDSYVFEGLGGFFLAWFFFSLVEFCLNGIEGNFRLLVFGRF